MQLVNLTPHALTLRAADGTDAVVPPSGTVARVAAAATDTGKTVAGLPVQTTTLGEVTDLPEPTTGTTYLVSAMVLGALAGSGRSDVFAPATGPKDGAVRDDQGHIVAVTRLNGVAP
jgi:hypothetical protein